MDINRAKEIIEALAEGIDPTTGELLSEDHVCNKGEVVRAFYSVLETLDKKRKKALPENAGKVWTNEEEILIKQLYSDGLSTRSIADKLGRSAGSIRSRLKRMGLTKG